MSIKKHYKPKVLVIDEHDTGIKRSATLHTIQKKLRILYVNIVKIVEKKPLLSFFSLLAFLFALIIIGNILRRPPETFSKVTPVKDVATYQIGTAPKIILTGQVEKSGVVSISSLMGGIVQNIYVKEGDKVFQGQWLIGLSTNYQGGNVLSLTRQLAEKQNQLVEENYPTQKDLIKRQKDLAEEQENNADKLRDIVSQSISDTQNVINLNNDIISNLDANLSNLSASSSANSELILGTKQLKSQFESANLQLNNSIRNAQYQSDTNNPVNNLVGINKDIVLKQLDIQDKALDLNKEMSKLQLKIAQVNEASMYPAAPFAGTIEKIHVKIGQNITGGTVLAVLSGTNNTVLKVTVLTTKEIAEKVSRLEPSTITFGSKKIQVLPGYITHEAVSNNLYAIIYQLPKEEYQNSTDKSYVAVEIPIGLPDTPSSVPFVPIDAIYQTQENASVFVIENGKAVNRPVTLGTVTGRYVQIEQGLKAGDSVVLDRNVIAGDEVKAK